MDNLLEHRWRERDRELNEKILDVQSEMNRRRILPSSTSVKEHHQIFRAEFQKSIEIIVKTVIDSLQSKAVKFDRLAFEEWSTKKIERRRDFLDSMFRERARVSIGSVQNQAMIASFMSVTQYYEHMAQELQIKLNRALDEYESQFGATLTDRIINRFKNRPLVAFGIIVITVVMAILGFVAVLRET